MNTGTNSIGKIDYLDGLPSLTSCLDYALAPPQEQTFVTILLMIMAHLLGNRKVTLFQENCQSVYADELGQQLARGSYIHVGR